MKHLKFLAQLAVALVVTGCVHTWRTETTSAVKYNYAMVTNADGSVTSVLANKVVLTDTDHGGAATLLADPTAVQVAVNHTNQAALGGSSQVSIGNLTWKTSSNAAPVVDAIGGAAGTIIGDAAKAVAQ